MTDIIKKTEDFVIGSGELHSVEEFAKKAFEHVNLNYKDYLKIDEKLIRKKDSVARLADITKAASFLKWTPKISFNRMVQDMVEADLKKLSE